MCLRRNRHGEVQPGVRCQETGARTGRRMEMQVRRYGHRQVLPRMRLSQAGGFRGLDLHLRHFE